MTCIYNKGQKEDPGRVMEQIILECHYAAQAGKSGDQAKTAWVLLDDPDALLRQGDPLSG